MFRRLCAIPLLLVALCYGVAYAQDVAAPAVAQVPAAPSDLSNYLLGLGPVGALAYGAFLMGKVANKGISIQVQLSEEDRELVKRAVEALEERDPHVVRVGRAKA